MPEYQVVNVPMQEFLLSEGMHREARMYLYLRDLARRGGGWIDYSSGFLLQGANSLQMSVATFRRHIKSIRDLGWIERSNNKLHISSINKIMNTLGLIGSHSVRVELQHICNRPDKEWKAFMYAVVVSNKIAASHFRHKSKSYYSQRDKCNVKRAELTINTVNYENQKRADVGQWAYSLSRKELNLSEAESSRLQKIAVRLGYLKQRPMFDPFVDDLKLTTKEKMFDFLRGFQTERFPLWLFRYDIYKDTYRFLSGLQLTSFIKIVKRKKCGKGIRHANNQFLGLLKVSIKSESLILGNFSDFCNSPNGLFE